MAEARQAIEKRELMPGRFIRERNMAEQSRPGGDLLAVCAAMQVIGASHVESLDTRGIDGANLMVGLETIAGYFGGIGEPNEHVLHWVDEYLHYLTDLRRARGAQLQHRHHPGGLRAAQARRAQPVQDLGLHGRRQPLVGASGCSWARACWAATAPPA